MIVRETRVAVRFALLAGHGTRLCDIRTISSHLHGIAQVRGWITAHLPTAEVLTTTSTAAAAEQVARGEIDAAVAAPLAAQQHGLGVVADDIADNPGAVTRFVLVTRLRRPPPRTGNDRTSLVVAIPNQPGALVGLLAELAERGVDLTRIESRPIKDRHAHYWFHLDCAGHVDELALREALTALHRRCEWIRFLGSYPRACGGESGRAELQAAPTPTAGCVGPAERWLEGIRTGAAS